MSFRGSTGSQSGNTYERTLKNSKSVSGSSSSSSDGESSHKLVMVGDSGVGKSCLLEKLLDTTSTNTFISTIGVEVKNHVIRTGDGRVVRLQVLINLNKKLTKCVLLMIFFASIKMTKLIYNFSLFPIYCRYGTQVDSKDIDQYCPPATEMQLGLL